MKKTFLIPVLLALSLLLSGCMLYHRLDSIDPENVVSISFYDLRDIHAYSGLHTKYETVFTLDPARNSEFIPELSTLRFGQFLLTMDSACDYTGWTARINFADGSFTLLSGAGSVETYKSDGKHDDGKRWTLGTEAWHDFLRSYLPPDYFE